MKIRALMLTASVLTLQPLLTAAAAAEGWETTLTPYLWAFGLDGDIKAREKSSTPRRASATSSTTWTSAAPSCSKRTAAPGSTSCRPIISV